MTRKKTDQEIRNNFKMSEGAYVGDDAHFDRTECCDHPAAYSVSHEVQDDGWRVDDMICQNCGQTWVHWLAPEQNRMTHYEFISLVDYVPKDFAEGSDGPQ